MDVQTPLAAAKHPFAIAGKLSTALSKINRIIPKWLLTWKTILDCLSKVSKSVIDSEHSDLTLADTVAGCLRKGDPNVW